MTMTPHLRGCAACSLGVAAVPRCSRPARAEDIDIYAEPNNAGDLPNVLFILDNSANWSTQHPGGRTATTRTAASSRPTVERPAGAGQEGRDREVRPLQPDRRAAGQHQRRRRPRRAVQRRLHAAQRVAEQRRLSAQGVHAADDEQQGRAQGADPEPHDRRDKGSNADFAKSMYEAYLYFKGLAPYQGRARARSATRTRSSAAATSARRAPRARATT